MTGVLIFMSVFGLMGGAIGVWGTIQIHKLNKAEKAAKAHAKTN